MFTSPIQALDLREGNNRIHVEAPIFIFTQGPSISASGLARFTVYSAVIETKWETIQTEENYDSERKIIVF